jgi:hypothetical protein
MHAELFGDLAQLIEARALDGHGLVLPVVVAWRAGRLAGDADELADEAGIAKSEAPLRKPITGIAAWCPRAALGQMRRQAPQEVAPIRVPVPLLGVTGT